MKDLSLSLYDIISHLIPGAAFLLIIIYLNPLPIGLPKELTLTAFAIFSYIVGHFLFAVGNLCYYTYFDSKKYKGKAAYPVVIFLEALIKGIVRQKYDNDGLDVKTDLDTLIMKAYGIKKLSNQARFQLCDALVASDGYVERETLLAKQGFYRAVTAFVILTSPIIYFRFGLAWQFTISLIASVVVTRLLLYAHTYYGRIRKNQIYFLAFVKLKKHE